MSRHSTTDSYPSESWREYRRAERQLRALRFLRRGEQILALIEPCHALFQHREQRQICDLHRGNLLLALNSRRACARHA